MPRKRPDPEEVAERIRKNAGESRGVVLDTLTDAMVDAGHAKGTLELTYVKLDDICDDRGLAPQEVHGQMRDMQEEVGALADWFEELEQALAEERATYKQAIDEFDV